MNNGDVSSLIILSLFALCFIFFVSLFSGAAMDDTDSKWVKLTVEKGVAEYDQKTGKWDWIDGRRR